jgi:hypothetical protein
MRDWLRNNHFPVNVSADFFKKDPVAFPDYETSIEEALCFGWVTALFAISMRKSMPEVHSAPRRLANGRNLIKSALLNSS